MKRLKLLCILLLACATSARAANPRWAMSFGDGIPAFWYHNNVSYFTDAGPLSPYVSHDAAVALVDAAANVWNVPSAALVLARGGSLNEDVNSANVYLGTSGPIWPADVQAANYDAKNIAVIFDADGSITDMLLGTGASAPSNCRQAAVTESVDLIGPPGYLQHALLILNGRCTGPAREQQLQMQYQLMRAFGRVLGVGWSQTNDNVFTGSPAPTYSQMLHWPIMHPIDILCGTYTYQCLPNPFQLREDDIAAIALLFPITSNPPAGKDLSLKQAVRIWGNVTFPNGMGMSGVNVVVHRRVGFLGIDEDFETSSAVTGALVRVENGNPLMAAAPASLLSGSPIRAVAGRYVLNRIPLAVNDTPEDFLVTTQPINPLYTGPYQVGPYRTSVVFPSGAATTLAAVHRVQTSNVQLNFPVNSTAVDCSSGNDGTESSPAQVDATGWWSGRFCGYGHTSWLTVAAKKDRTLTIEVTALDESANPTPQKALPLIGVWSASDGTGTLPTLGSTANTLNGRTVGLTRLPLTLANTQQLRIAIAEKRGEGRPDFNYRARILYADSVSPARVMTNGGRIVIRGMGFQTGNTVTVGGLLATVESWSANEIIATAPALPSNISAPFTADVVVTDLRTGGSTKITAGIIYGGVTTDTMQTVNAPSGNVFSGSTAASPFTVRLVNASGAPLRSAAITFNVSSGSARFSCGLPPCSVFTDANGLAQTSVTPLTIGAVTLQASASGGASASATFQSIAAARAVTAIKATQLVAAGANYTWQPQVVVSVNGNGAASVPVLWSSSAHTLAAAPATNTNSVAGGMASTSVTTTFAADSQMALNACAWTDVCAALQAKGVDSAQWRVQNVSGDTQSVAAATTLSAVTLRIVNSSGDPVAAVPVTIYQRAEGWQPACGNTGRCPTPPVYGSASSNLVSDNDGLVSFTPLQYASTAAITRITASAGPQGYDSFALEKHP